MRVEMGSLEQSRVIHSALNPALCRALLLSRENSVE